MLPEPLIQSLRDARSVGVVTGAGVSAASGIPTYRGLAGLYERPGEGESLLEALSGSTFRADPARTWRALLELARKSLRAEPNSAHFALARLEGLVPDFVLLTQNVDGLHRRAGSRKIIEIHGDLRTTRCLACGATGTLHIRHADAGTPPRCPRCEGPVRPAVVLFEEALDERDLAAVRQGFLQRIPDVVVAAGTTALFPYIAETVRMAAAHGRVTVEVNPARTELSGLVSYGLRGGAEVLLPELVAAAFGPE